MMRQRPKAEWLSLVRLFVCSYWRFGSAWLGSLAVLWRCFPWGERCMNTYTGMISPKPQWKVHLFLLPSLYSVRPILLLKSPDGVFSLSNHHSPHERTGEFMKNVDKLTEVSFIALCLISLTNSSEWCSVCFQVFICPWFRLSGCIQAALPLVALGGAWNHLKRHISDRKTCLYSVESLSENTPLKAGGRDAFLLFCLCWLL